MSAPDPGVGQPSILPRVEADVWARLTLAPRVVTPVDPAVGHAIVLRAIQDGAGVTAALEGTTVIGAVITRHADDAPRSDLLALGVAPDWRRQGLATRLLATRLEFSPPDDVEHEALVTVAERDPLEPLALGIRTAIARRLLTGAGFDVGSAVGAIGGADPTAIRATRSALSRAD